MALEQTQQVSWRVVLRSCAASYRLIGTMSLRLASSTTKATVAASFGCIAPDNANSYYPIIYQAFMLYQLFMLYQALLRSIVLIRAAGSNTTTLWCELIDWLWKRVLAIPYSIYHIFPAIAGRPVRHYEAFIKANGPPNVGLQSLRAGDFVRHRGVGRSELEAGAVSAPLLDHCTHLSHQRNPESRQGTRRIGH